MTEVVPETLSQDLTPTGIDGLDELLRGGFQRGSLVMVAGNPGTGKSVLATKFLCTGIDADEPGIYVSFSEDAATLIDNMTRHLGNDVGDCLRSEKFRFLNFDVMSQTGLDAILRTILNEVQKLGARRLVIDSYSAMAQAFDREEIRSVLHAVLGKLVRDIGCTTIVISEVPRGTTSFGVGVEEFVADGVITLQFHESDGRVYREIEVLKMRGAKLDRTRCLFSLDEGFKVFMPIGIDQVKKQKVFNGIVDLPDRYSSGLVQLDDILGGGYQKGSIVLLEIEENVSTLEYNMFTLPCIGNFLMHDKSVIEIPSVGVGLGLSMALMMQAAPADKVASLVKLCIPKEHLTTSLESSHVLTFDGDDVPGSVERFTKMVAELTERFVQTSLYIEGVDTLFSSFGPENVLKILNSTINSSRTHGNLNLIILRPGIPAPFLYDMLRSVSDVHLRLTKKLGVLLFYGLKPWTGMYSVQQDHGRGYPWPTLVPLV